MPESAIAIAPKLHSTPATITGSTPTRRISGPVKNDGANMPMMCDEITKAASLYGWPQTCIAIGVEVMRKFITP